MKHILACLGAILGHLEAFLGRPGFILGPFVSGLPDRPSGNRAFRRTKLEKMRKNGQAWAKMDTTEEKVGK